MTRPTPLPGTRALDMQGDLAAQMVAGIDRYLTHATQGAARDRARFWHRDFSSREMYDRSVEPNRARLRTILGVVDPRLPAAEFEFLGGTSTPSRVADAAQYTVDAVRWPVLPGVDGEGLLLRPKGRVRARVVALPDCDWTPEMLVGLAPGIPAEAQYALRLAKSGCEVLVPVLIDRRDTFSGEPGARMTNQPHREFLYRGAFEMGRTLVGYEVQKVLAAVDLFAREPGAKIGVFGYGEGGLLALYSAAIDTRIDAAVVSGYFGPREELWREPIYRNVFGLLEQFGDAELASLVAPRTLIVEEAKAPAVSGPPAPHDGRSGAAPGAIVTPASGGVASEIERAKELVRGFAPADRPAVADPVAAIRRAGSAEGLPGTSSALTALLNALGIRDLPAGSGEPTADRRAGFDPQPRQKRQFEQLLEYTQRLLGDGDKTRTAFWSRADASSPQKWRETTRSYRDALWNDVIGRFPPPDQTAPGTPEPGDPRSRLVYDEPNYRGYEVMLDVWPDVFAYGILLVPKDIRHGERRPVVVCQHGLEGRPSDVADPKVDNHFYHRFACRLADEGFVTFAPQNPYIGEDAFRVLQRKANPLGKSLFSVILAQHQRILEWLGTQPFVDRSRIGFYGLSYGGKTAMRVPALLDGYCLSICSADFNDWIRKCVDAHSPYSYLLTNEYEMPEWNLGQTFNYAEMSGLICPRPFMVERGHDDGVAPDEWVAYEYAKVRRLYDRLGLGDRTELEVFNGPHTIHGVGTFAFLRKHLRWPHGH